MNSAQAFKRNRLGCRLVDLRRNSKLEVFLFLELAGGFAYKWTKIIGTAESAMDIKQVTKVAELLPKIKKSAEVETNFWE